MKAWAIVLAALIAGAGAISAIVIVSSSDQAPETRTATITAEPAFEATPPVEEEDKEKPTASPAPVGAAPSRPSVRAATGDEDEDSAGGSSVDAINGEFAGSSEGEDEDELEAEEEEEEAEQEEDEQRCKERDDPDDDC